MTPHLRAAFSAAGAAFAEHVRDGDTIPAHDLGQPLVECVNYTLRAKGLEIVMRPPMWTVVRTGVRRS